MNILFLSLGRYWSVNEHEIYTDLLREFIKNGDKVYILSPIERREHKKAEVIEEKNSQIIKVKIGNIQKTNILEKGISTLLVEYQFLAALKRHWKDVRFDLVLYPTPPITFVKVVRYIKKRDQATAYLMLKDIFPQNAVDIGILRKKGILGVIYRYFRRKEKKLYQISDRIGCMSQANAAYIIRNNPDIDPCKVEICPNAIEPRFLSISSEEKIRLRETYGLPTDQKIFIYGGNLGKPQGINFIIECIKKCREIKEAYFMIVGSGTEFQKLEQFVKSERPQNIKLLSSIPRDEFERLTAACDIGLIFLDHRFTIPNFPSRLLSYMQAGLPALAATDVNTDIGKVIEQENIGYWCESADLDTFQSLVQKLAHEENGFADPRKVLQEKYSVQVAFRTIMEGLSIYGD